MQYAVISDVHGNRWALEAVLEDFTRRGITRCLNLGDSLYGPLDPAGTAGLLMQRRDPTVLGNEDRILLSSDESTDTIATIRFVQQSLGPQARSWIASLPPTMLIDGEILLCHGTPECDDRYLLQDIGPGGLGPRSADAVDELLAGVTARVVLCGHDHTSASVRTPARRWVFNPGSVGLPAYADEWPHRHAMQAGSPHARYGILMRLRDRWIFEPVHVSYDWSAAAEAARRNGRADWAQWLATGCAKTR